MFTYGHFLPNELFLFQNDALFGKFFEKYYNEFDIYIYIFIHKVFENAMKKQYIMYKQTPQPLDSLSEILYFLSAASCKWAEDANVLEYVHAHTQNYFSPIFA